MIDIDYIRSVCNHILPDGSFVTIIRDGKTICPICGAEVKPDNLDIARSYLNNVSEQNCNARLSYLYKKRDSIGRSIDTLIVKGYSTDHAEANYNEICDIIEQLCEFRKHHNCLLEGDPGYTLE